jgi:hypothetical protein
MTTSKIDSEKFMEFRDPDGVVRKYERFENPTNEEVFYAEINEVGIVVDEEFFRSLLVQAAKAIALAKREGFIEGSKSVTMVPMEVAAGAL